MTRERGNGMTPTQRTVHRTLVAVPQGGRQVFLAWRLLAEDAPEVAFHVERREPGSGWQRVGGGPVTDSTNWLDHTPEGARYEYRVSTGDQVSESVEVDSSLPKTNIAVRAPLRVPGVQCGRVCTGDLDGDGRMDFVVLCRDQGRIMLDAYRGDGEPMWRIDTGLPARGGWDGGTLHCPFALWDVNGDGRVEVVFHSCDSAGRAAHTSRRTGKATDPEAFYKEAGPGETLAVADGETGELIYEVPWPATCARVMMTVGHLRGIDEPAAIVVLDETYGDVVLTAVDGRAGSTLWQVHQARPAGHNLDICDIDEDGPQAPPVLTSGRALRTTLAASARRDSQKRLGLQEVICGGICYNGDGTVRWEAEPFGHTDISKADHIHPDLPGRQVFYAVESENPGVYLVDNQGKTIWKETFKHAHFGWIARHTAEHPGLQLHCAEDARRGMREVEHNPVFLCNGSHWLSLTDWQRKNFVPVQWDAGEVTVFIVRKEHRLVRLLASGETESVPPGDLPPGGVYERNLLCCDILGDYREEIVTIDREKDELIVLVNTELNDDRGYSPRDDFDYRHDRSQHGSGYYIYKPPPDTRVVQ